MIKKITALRFKNKIYTIHPSFSLVQEIESELGSMAGLQKKFSDMSWEVSDLVTIVHMMLHEAGETVDYLVLGNSMLREGLRPYLSTVQSFLDSVVSEREAA